MPSAGSPDSQLQWDWSSRGREESLAGVLTQCAGLSHLNLWNDGIKAAGAGSFAGVLAQCAELAHLTLNLRSNGIGDVWAWVIG